MEKRCSWLSSSKRYWCSSKPFSTCLVLDLSSIFFHLQQALHFANIETCYRSNKVAISIFSSRRRTAPSKRKKKGEGERRKNREGIFSNKNRILKLWQLWRMIFRNRLERRGGCLERLFRRWRKLNGTNRIIGEGRGYRGKSNVHLVVQQNY